MTSLIKSLPFSILSLFQFLKPFSKKEVNKGERERERRRQQEKAKKKRSGGNRKKKKRKEDNNVGFEVWCEL